MRMGSVLELDLDTAASQVNPKSLLEFFFCKENVLILVSLALSAAFLFQLSKLSSSKENVRSTEPRCTWPESLTRDRKRRSHNQSTTTIAGALGSPRHRQVGSPPLHAWFLVQVCCVAGADYLGLDGRNCGVLF